MNNGVRSVAALVLAAGVAVPAAAIPSSADTTALIMGGTFHPLVEPRDGPEFVTGYLDNAVNGHLDPAFGAAGGPVTNAVAVFTPEDFFPLGPLTFDKSVAAGLVNLNSCLAVSADCVYNSDPGVMPQAGTGPPEVGDALLVFGYSQSAVIASLAKAELIDTYEIGDPAVSFMFIANSMRPNGGVLMRLHRWPTIPVLEISFPGATRTDSAGLGDGLFAYPTVDFVRQYDALGGDFPLRPLNLVALANSLLGYGLLHGETVDVPFSQAHYQGREGDTSYYMVQTDIVPLLQPFEPFIPAPILKALDAPLRVIIEDAYDRTIAPGTPTGMRWWPVGDPVALVVNLLSSVPVAIDNLFEGFGHGRVLGTTAPGPFGVGGPELSGTVESVASASDVAVASDSLAGESAPAGEPAGQDSGADWDAPAVVESGAGDSGEVEDAAESQDPDEAPGGRGAERGDAGEVGTSDEQADTDDVLGEIEELDTFDTFDTVDTGTEDTDPIGDAETDLVSALDADATGATDDAEATASGTDEVGASDTDATDATDDAEATDDAGGDAESDTAA